MQRLGILVSIFVPLAIVMLATLIGAPGPVDGQSKSSIIQYYWDRTAWTLARNHPDSIGQEYVLRATTFYKHVNSRGVVTSTDTTVARYFHSQGRLDSVVAVGKAHVPTKKIDLSCPNIFRTRYHLNFFPNDTGGADLAVGFENDSTARPAPTGLAIIDRNTFYPMWLYLYYPDMPGYKRLTRSFRFTRQEDLVFPDSVWEVGAIAGIFTSEYYRIETGVDSIIVAR